MINQFFVSIALFGKSSPGPAMLATIFGQMEDRSGRKARRREWKSISTERFAAPIAATLSGQPIFMGYPVLPIRRLNVTSAACRILPIDRNHAARYQPPGFFTSPVFLF